MLINNDDLRTKEEMFYKGIWRTGDDNELGTALIMHHILMLGNGFDRPMQCTSNACAGGAFTLKSQNILQMYPR